MNQHNREINQGALIAFLAVAIALIPAAIYISDPQWLRIGILLVAVALIAVISFLLLRDVRRRRTNRD